MDWLESKKGDMRSPLPFGVLRVHHSLMADEIKRIADGLHCLSAFSAFTTQEANLE